MKRLNLDTYKVHNTVCVSAAVWKTCIRLALKSVKGEKENIPLVFPLEVEVFDSLFEIFGASLLSDFAGKPCRFMSVNDNQPLIGVAHFMNDGCISYADYWDHGDPERGRLREQDDGEMFTMATIDPPPGLPWLLRETDDYVEGRKLHNLIDSDGNTIAEKMNYDVAMWLSEKAKLATVEDPNPIPF